MPLALYDDTHIFLYPFVLLEICAPLFSIKKGFLCPFSSSFYCHPTSVYMLLNKKNNNNNNNDGGGGFHNIELPCDWTVNRRPTQNATANSSNQGLGENGRGGGGQSAKKRRAASSKDEKEEDEDKSSSDSKQKKRHSQKKKQQPPTSIEEEEEAVNAPEKEEEEVRQHHTDADDKNGNNDGKEDEDSHSDIKKKKADADTVVIESHPLGFISVFPACDVMMMPSNANAIIESEAVSSKRRVKALILKKLDMAAENPAQKRTDDPHIIDTEGLLSRLPYKKMLSDMFGGSLRGNLRSADIPYVTRAYEEAFMRAPLNSTERECAKGEQCECMFIDRTQPFVGVEFLLPGEALPRTPHLCVLCCRATTQQLYYDVMFDKAEFPGVIQRYGNIHSQPGEYSLDAMLIAVGSAPVHIMPLPIVSHQRNRYSVHVSGGIKRLKQSRVYFQSTPSCSASSGM